MLAGVRLCRSARCGNTSRRLWIGSDRAKLLPKLLPETSGARRRPVGSAAKLRPLDSVTGLAKIACPDHTSPVDTPIVDRVRELIQRSGLTQKDFAEHIDLEPDRLSKSLSGRRNFSSFELALIAQRSGVTVDWILTGAVPAAPAIAARANLDDAVDGEAIGAVARRFADAHDQLEMLAERPTLPEVPPLRAGPYLRVAETLAMWAHGQLALRGLSVVDSHQDTLLASIEQCFGIDAAVTGLPTGLDGYAWQIGTMRLLIVGRTPYWPRQRFSIAHELGHLLAHDAQDLIAESVDTRAKDPSEKRANAFAAAFLMPADFLQEQAAGGVDQEVFGALVNRLFVSPLSLGWRLFNLHLISESDRASWSKPTAERYALQANRTDLILAERRLSDGERLPSRLASGHLHAYQEGKTSARPLASLLGVDAAQVIELFARR